MKPSSAKAKGRRLQNWLRDLILNLFPSLAPDDVISRSSGANGEDLILSPLARKSVPMSFECKSVSKASIYTFYEQARGNAGKHEPVVILKANGKTPLAIVDATYLLTLMQELEKKK